MEEEPLDSDQEEGDNEEEYMAYPNLDWMTQGPLKFLGVLHKMPRHSEKLLTKYDPDKTMKVEDHLEKIYVHLQTLEVRYDDFEFSYVLWMVQKLYGITPFLQTPSKIRGGLRRYSLENLLMIRPPPCY